jgi:hypothetical protein
MPKPVNAMSPAEGIEAIQYSLRCFAYSVASLVPVLGVPMAVAAFVNFRKARALTRGDWNPAQAYLIWGSALGSLGLLLSLLVVLFVVSAILQLLPWQYNGNG